MTHHKRSAVTCDNAAGCANVVIDDGPQARQFAKAAGWVETRRNGRTTHLCPAHKGGPR